MHSPHRKQESKRVVAFASQRVSLLRTQPVFPRTPVHWMNTALRKNEHPTITISRIQRVHEHGRGPHLRYTNKNIFRVCFTVRGYITQEVHLAVFHSPTNGHPSGRLFPLTTQFRVFGRFGLGSTRVVKTLGCPQIPCKKSNCVSLNENSRKLRHSAPKKIWGLYTDPREARWHR